jgi:hypothetical protein
LNRYQVAKTNDTIEVNDHYILYRDSNENLAVLSRYNDCKSNNSTKCNCAFYLMLNQSKYVYLDFCDQKQVQQSSLSLKYLNAETKLTGSLDCSYLINDEENVQFDNVSSFHLDENLKCARLNTNCSSYLLRTVNQTNNIQIRLNVNCEKDFLSQIEIESLSSKMLHRTDGICGLLHIEEEPSNCTNYIVSSDDDYVCENDSQKLLEYWKYAIKIFILN